MARLSSCYALGLILLVFTLPVSAQPVKVTSVNAEPVNAEPEVLRLLVWEGYAPQAQREQFQRYVREKYDRDIRLDVRYITKAEDCYTALRLKTADILSPAHNRINDKRFRMIELGLLLPLDFTNIPNYADLDSRFQHPEYLTRDGLQYGSPFAWGPYGLIYNTELVESPPTSWNALWDPQYRGRFSIADLGEINIYVTALALGYEAQQLRTFESLNNEAYNNKLAQLVIHTKSFWQGVDTADDIQGLAIAASWGFSLPELRRRGELWKRATLEEKSPGWIDNYVISHTLKDQPELKKIAEEWINFTLSPGYQAEVLVRELGTRPVNLAVKKLLTAAEIEEVELGEAGNTEQAFILMPELDRRARNGFDLLWHKALMQRDNSEQGAGL